MLDFATVVAVNKFDRSGALDALRDIRKQVQRNTHRCSMRSISYPNPYPPPGVRRIYFLLSISGIVKSLADRLVVEGCLFVGITGR